VGFIIIWSFKAKRMYYIIAFFSGIAGTLLMTVFMKVISIIGNINFEIPRILGSVITMETKPSGRASTSFLSLATGYTAHFITGILFALIYCQLWLRGIGAPEFGYALLFGTVNGLLAVGIWYGILKLHPLAPAVPANSYLFFLFISHLVFAVSMAFTFCVLTAILK
jgi:hypothetical protein